MQVTERTWPLATQTDDAQVSEAEWSRYHRNLAQTGVFGTPDDTSLKAVADATGVRQVIVYPGQATIFGYSYSNDANVTLVMAANTSATARLDLVVLRYDSSADPASRISIKIVQGSSSSAPALNRSGTSASGVYEVKIATVTVAANAATLAPSSASDDREFASTGVIAFADPAHVDLARVKMGQVYTVGGSSPQAYIKGPNGTTNPVTPTSTYETLKLTSQPWSGTNSTGGISAQIPVGTFRVSTAGKKVRITATVGTALGSGVSASWQRIILQLQVDDGYYSASRVIGGNTISAGPLQATLDFNELLISPSVGDHIVQLRAVTAANFNGGTVQVDSAAFLVEIF